MHAKLSLCRLVFSAGVVLEGAEAVTGAGLADDVGAGAVVVEGFAVVVEGDGETGFVVGDEAGFVAVVGVGLVHVVVAGEAGVFWNLEVGPYTMKDN